MAALVVGFWFVAPAISFIIFLAISMFHFGKGDMNTQGKQFSTSESLARGGVVIAGISQFHKTDADTIFQCFNRLKDQSSVAVFGCCSGYYDCLLRNFTCRKRGQERGRFFGEIAGLTLIFTILPPLVGFSIYFCLIHSMRHFATMRAMLADTISKTANHENYCSVFRNVLGCGTGCNRSPI